MCEVFVDFLLDNDETGPLLENIPISRLEYKNHSLFMTKMDKIS